MQLKDILLKVARKTNRIDDYANGTDEDIKTLFTDGINRAIRYVIEEKYPIDTGESKTLDANSCFLISTLTEECRSIKRIQYSATDTTEYDYEFLTLDKVYVHATASTSVYVVYRYVPDALSALTDECPIPESIIDPDVIADGAVAYYWQTQERFDKSNMWDAIFNRALDDLFVNRGAKRMKVRRMR